MRTNEIARTFSRSLLALIAMTVLSTAALAQATYTVTNNSNSGAGSLRQAIINLNAGTSPGSIVFNISGSKVINLMSELPAIQKSVSINSAGVAGIVLDGASAGFSDGLRFHENTGNFSNVTGLTVRNFQKSAIVINPSNSNEQVNIDNCYLHSCDINGVSIAGGRNHQISGDSVIENNDGWGINITTSTVTGVQIIGGAVQGNTLGGARFVGDNNRMESVYLVGNGSAEASDHRGSVVMGGTSAATNCRVEDCTIAGNTPWGVKRLAGSTGEVRGNETYANTQLGIKNLGAQPSVTPYFFVVDDIHDEIVIKATATGNANQSLNIEFFVPVNAAPDTQGAAYIDAADTTVTLDGTGTTVSYHKFSRDAVFAGEAFGLPQPLQFQIEDTDGIVATATSSSSGTSEFSARAEATLPGDFDLNGIVDGGDFLIWQRGTSITNAEYWQGDADFDGDVDGDDLDIWEANFGQTP